ncbi:hypothetical protein L9F63_018834, partial [Diploptera punctata]
SAVYEELQFRSVRLLEKLPSLRLWGLLFSPRPGEFVRRRIISSSDHSQACNKTASEINISMAELVVPPAFHASSPLLEMASLRLPDSEEYEFENRRRADSLFTSSSTDSSILSESGTKLVDFLENGGVDFGQEVSSDLSVSNTNVTLGNFTFGGNYTMEQIPFYRHSLAMTAVYCFAYILVFAVGLVGNCFVIAVVYRSPRMRTVTNFFIVNLAVADILVIVFCLPATLLSNIFV